MEPYTLSRAAELCNGRFGMGEPRGLITDVSIDSRTIQPGALFFALQTENADGHDFAHEAGEKGAAGVVVSEFRDSYRKLPCGFIMVENTLGALHSFALNHRLDLDIKVAAITGSSGKTTAKDFIASVMRRQFRVSATEGNLNNHLGLPLTILRTRMTERIGVWELGINHPGEMRVLTELARPDFGVITNIGDSHLEYMKSREIIAREKGVLIETIDHTGVVVLNADDEFTPSLRERTEAQVITCGIENGDIRARNLQPQPDDGITFTVDAQGDTIEARLPVPGRHMVLDALFAVALGRIAGLPLSEIADGLEEAPVSGHRLQRREINGIHVLDDSYNANPDSVKAALDTMLDLPCEGKRVAALGVMAELGEVTMLKHGEVGKHAMNGGIDLLISVGDPASSITIEAERAGMKSALHFSSHGEAAKYLLENLKPGDLLLVKGSRVARMEKVIEALES